MPLSTIKLITALLWYSGAQNALAQCTSPRDPGCSQKVEYSPILQVRGGIPLRESPEKDTVGRTEDARILLQQHGAADLIRMDCPLPKGAKWCTVRIPGVKQFDMAVYDWREKNDYVSNLICQNGFWEDMKLADLGPPGHALDIGGNIGYFSFVLARANWNVSTFEPFADNVKLMEATLCRNPSMKANINIHKVGLGAHPDTCQLMSDITNFGDGHTRCGEEAAKAVPGGYEVRQSFPVQRLDDVLSTEAVPKIDFVKIDVEGFECQVFEGGRKLLDTYKPRLIRTEAWAQMQGCERANYLQMFVSSGYKVASDELCEKKAMDAKGEPITQDFWICKKMEDSSFLLSADLTRTPRLTKQRVLFKLE